MVYTIGHVLTLIQENRMTPKPFYFSKTVWLNIILTLIGALALATDTIPTEYKPWAILAGGVLNVVLRVWFTDSPVAH